MSEEGKILSAKKNGVGTLTFSNPERLNAMSREMTRAAAEVMEDFTQDAEVRVVIITGAGKKAFISGGDISKFEKARATPEQLVEYNKDSARFRVALRGVGKPTIAMIRGWCLGGGLAVALNCDMRICTEDSQFGVPAARLGIGYGAESLGQLVELCGPAVTKELMFTARRYTAAMMRSILDVAYEGGLRPSDDRLPNLRYLGVGPEPSQIIKDVPPTVELVKLA